MKKLVIVLIIAVVGQNVLGQVKTGTLQAAGLTCAMCTKAINETLKELSFIQTVTSDIKNSQFVLVFKDGVNVDPDALKKAVEDAGFSVAKLKLTLDFNNVKVEKDAHISLGGRTYHFVDTRSQTLDGEKTITFVDKNFVLPKEFKKYAAKTQMPCVQSGKAEACCKKEGINANSRIFHVTI
jgi:copper chaperone CopZ